MEQNMQIFENKQFGKIRTLEINGEVWFVGKDVATCLGYSNSRDALSKHVLSEDKDVANCDTPGGVHQMAIINESGLYSLIIGSRLPLARQLQRWITSEVLPTMGKIGFSRSMQALREENMKLKQQQASYEQNSMFAATDRVEVTEMRNQIIDKLHTIPIGTPITQELKQYLIQYDPSWEG